MQDKVAKLLQDFRKLPANVLIDRPDESLTAYSTFVFTRKSLKHLSEKADCIRIFELIPDTLEFPHVITRSRGRRDIYARFMDKKMHVVVVEGKNTIVTAFFAKEKYLKNFKILWRTAYPPSAYTS